MVALIRRRSLFAFCALTFLLAWGGIALVIGPGGVALDEAHLAQLLGFGYVGMLVGPSLSAILLTWVLDGGRGLRTLLAESVHWRTGGQWWAIAVLTAPVTIVAVLFVLSLVSSDYVARLLVDPDPAGLLQFVAVTAVITGIFEELGWTGFATKMLLARHGVVRTALVIGLLSAVWNLPIVYLKEVSVPTPGFALPLFLAVGLLTWQMAFRVLIVRVYERTHSVLLAMVMQASLVAAWTSLTPLALDRTTVSAYYLVLTAVWCLGAWLMLRTRIETYIRVSSSP